MKNRKDKLKLILTFAIMVGLMAMGFYWLSIDAEKSESDRINAMSQGYSYSKGIISRFHSYKGRTLEVKYQINGINYDKTRNWSINSRNVGIGDSISFKYATENPNFIITELEDGY